MTERRNIHPLICDYIASKGENGNQYLYPEGDGENPSPNPRKWEMASDLLYSGAPHKMLIPLLGEDIVSDFSTFCNDASNERKTKRKTRLERLAPDTTPRSQRQKITKKEFIQYWIDGKQGPAIIRCHSGQDWRTLFDKPFVLMDATKMTFAELCGMDYRTRTYFVSAWFQDLLCKKILVIENLDMLTPRDEELTDDLELSEYGEAHPGQISFLFLCRGSEETDRNAGNLHVVPTDVTTFIILKDNPKYQIIQPIFSRCGFIDMAEREKVGDET